jgi:pyruvate dehydrogenase E2 component (dihydrolipoamide acetyltransferase)
MELQAFDTGTVAAIMLKAGDSVEVGKNILVLAEEGEDAAAIRAQFASGATASAPKASATEARGSKSVGAVGSSPAATAVLDAPAPPATSTHGVNGHADASGRIFASPLAKKIAAEKGLDLASIDGTGPGGRITRKDVEGAQVVVRAASPATRTATAARAPSLSDEPSPLASRTENLSNMRRTIATRLVQSKQSIPHYQVTLAVNMDPLLTLRQQLNDQLASQGVKLSVNDFIVRATALAMHQHPYVNSSWGADGGSIILHERVNIGVAISLPAEKGGGLVVATLRDADRIGLRQISAQTKALADKARTRGLTIEEMDGSTFTISNLGMFGVEHFTAIINPPNVAILAVGAAVEKAVVRDGQLAVGHEMQMTMSSDHRVVDGAMAAAYLATVKQLLEAPATLLV